MTFEVIFTMKRTDDSHEFWWESTDPEIVKMCRRIDALARTQNIQRMSGKSADNRTYESRFIMSNITMWKHFMNTVVTEMPDMLEKRTAYLVAANHAIQLVINNADTSSTVLNTDSPVWILAQ